VVIDSTNLPNQTGYHTLTILAFLAWLRTENKIKAERLTKVKLLLVKEFLTHVYPGDYSFKSSEFLTIDASEIELDDFENRVKHKKGSQAIDLKSFMDERTLAREAVDLNIKLMKWRLLPSLDIPLIQSAKCLLFGAGTLGCQLARNLIGWGVKNISFVDYSKVSYSNPVRQTLYEYEDTINGGKPKAETAAERLRKIYPEINAHGYSISIPMPGHYVRTEDQIRETFKNLDFIEKLVEEHDVVFLLLDSREARWLPTVLANKYDKACITVGLGFDSYLIVRHGVSPNLYNQGIFLLIQRSTGRDCVATSATTS
jgi:ubiquitin-like modifier-activating enzyme ATG7